MEEENEENEEKINIYVAYICDGLILDSLYLSCFILKTDYMSKSLEFKAIDLKYF